MVLQLIFKSFIHFELILVYGVSWWSCFIFFTCSCLVLPTPFIEEAILLHFMLLPPLSNIETWVYLWTLYSVPLVYVSVLKPVSGCFDYSGLVV